MVAKSSFRENGWARFPSEPAVLDWANHALPAARRSVRDPALSHWLQCAGTWFVGVDALDNDAQGRVAESGLLAGQALAFLHAHYGPMPPLHKAQISVVYPGYRYRLNRDGAHVDGLLPVGPERRRILREPHAFVLGLPLNKVSSNAAPLVVWEGSHLIMQEAFGKVLAGHDAAKLKDVDVTETYHVARRKVFETCPRIVAAATPGEVVLLHRMTLHRVAPWAKSVGHEPEGRIIAYFRPEMPDGVKGWISPDQ